MTSFLDAFGEQLKLPAEEPVVEEQTLNFWEQFEPILAPALAPEETPSWEAQAPETMSQWDELVNSGYLAQHKAMSPSDPNWVPYDSNTTYDQWLSGRQADYQRKLAEYQALQLAQQSPAWGAMGEGGAYYGGYLPNDFGQFYLNTGDGNAAPPVVDPGTYEQWLQNQLMTSPVGVAAQQQGYSPEQVQAFYQRYGMPHFDDANNSFAQDLVSFAFDPAVMTMWMPFMGGANSALSSAFGGGITGATAAGATIGGVKAALTEQDVLDGILEGGLTGGVNSALSGSGLFGGFDGIDSGQYADVADNLYALADFATGPLPWTDIADNLYEPTLPSTGELMPLPWTDAADNLYEPTLPSTGELTPLPWTDAADNVYALPPELVAEAVPQPQPQALTDAADNLYVPPQEETPWWAQPRPETLSGPASVLNPEGGSSLIETPAQAAAAGLNWSAPGGTLEDMLANAQAPRSGMFDAPTPTAPPIPALEDLAPEAAPEPQSATEPQMQSQPETAPSGSALSAEELARYTRLAQSLQGLFGGGGGGNGSSESEAPADAPQRTEGMTDEQYVEQLVNYLGIDAEAMAAAGLTPGSPEYYEYLMSQADQILRSILGEFDDNTDWMTLLRGKTQEEVTRLMRALWVRGVMQQMMGAGRYRDPFSEQDFDVFGPDGATFNPSTGAYHRGLASFLESLKGMNPEDARRALMDFLDRNPDLFGMQAAKNRRYQQALLESPEEDPRRKRRGMLG
jgi:hypothetical protein